jgi:chromosome segregation ATPase
MNQLLSVLFVLCIILGFFTYDFYGDSSRSQAAYQSVLAEEANLRQSLKDEQDRESAANAKISDLEQKLAKAQQAASSGPGGDNGTPPPLTITNSSGKVFTLNQADYDRLLPQSQALDKEGAGLDQRKGEISKSFDDLNRRSGSIDNTNADAVNQYNAEIEAAKATQTKFNEDIAVYNSKINDFNTELERVAISSK